MRTANIRHRFTDSVIPHTALLIYTAIALFPILLVIMNSFKARKAIFREPLALPNPETFSLEGYATVWDRAGFPIYFRNSLTVTLASIFFILLFGAMAAYALSEYKFKGNTLLGLYLALGIMIPIRLGTVGILRLVASMGLVNNLLGLIFVYIAQGLPLTVFVLQSFMSQVPREMKEAARVDGASEYRIFGLVLPMVRPAVATVAVFVMIPIWNDLWFPLILAPGESTKTVTLGAQQFLGQFISDWNAVLASLTLAMIPVLILYIVFSRQLIRGITSGAIK
ncbi:MAG: ABC transporter permease subunit [Chloroflexi bacterium]|jgi:raffinose/stachyose/melibiose transport system permease protein|nr:ABC transporter permease subunit [Chloroflexota bacterium]